MTTPNTVEMVKAIESRYGVYTDKDLRKDVGRMLFRRYHDDKQCLDCIIEAIKEYQETRFGPPDVAQIVKAVEKYEDTYGIAIIPPRRPILEPRNREEEQNIREETLIDLRETAKKYGIDTTKEAWVSSLLLAQVAEKNAKGI